MATWPFALLALLLTAAVQSAVLLRELTLWTWALCAAFGAFYGLLGWALHIELRWHSACPPPPPDGREK